MSVLRFRVTGTQDQVDRIVSVLNGLDKLERVEQVDDEIGDLRDDSSSADAVDDIAGTDVHRIEVETPHHSTNAKVHDLVEVAARDIGVAVEFVDRF